MNKERILELASCIERWAQPFDMGTMCGTAFCIAGYGSLLWPQFQTTQEGWDGNPYSWVDTGALADWLGITQEEKGALFFPEDDYWDKVYDEDFEYCCFSDTRELLEYSDLTRAGAVATLRRLAETGEVKWLKKEQK